MKHLSAILLGICLISGLGMTGCIEDGFTTSPSHVLSFSTDTVSFDTVFTTISTSYRSFRIYNRNKKSVNISSIRVADAEHTGFQINVDGISGESFSDVEIRGKDSIFVFVKMKVDPTDRNNPIEIKDSIIFVTNGVAQDVKLRAYGQDVIIERGKTLTESTTLPNERPYLIYDSLVVAPEATLHLTAGTTLHFHDKADLIVKGKLICEGDPGNPVVLRGDRLDRMFDDLPYDNLGGQWGGIHFIENSTGNRLSYTSVRGMSTGIVLNSDNKDEQTLEIANSVVHNSSGDLITSNFNKLYVWNSEISDAGSAVVRLSGGEARFIHCTLTNYYFYDIIRDPILTLHYALPSEINDTIDAPLLKAEFANCLIYGKTSDINADDLTGSDVFLRNCLLRAAGEDDDNFIATVWDGKPMFKAVGEEHYYYNYEIGSEKSDAIQKGDPQYAVAPLDHDMYGISRTQNEAPDIGAYQYVGDTPEE